MNLSPMPAACVFKTWIFEDGEPDDLEGIRLTGQSEDLIIAEKHPKRGESFERTATLVALMGKDILILQGHTPIALSYLLETLPQIPDKSLCINIWAPAPTLQQLIEREPQLLAQKINRIVWFGGMTLRPPLNPNGTPTGEPDAYYTTYNLSSNLQAAQTILNFADNDQAQFNCYIIGSDALRLSRKLNTWIPQQMIIAANQDSKAAKFILEDMAEWNARFNMENSKAAQKMELVAQEAGVEQELVKKFSMTPGDTIAAIISIAHERIEISSMGISNAQILEIPRYELNTKTGKCEKSKHRQITFVKNPISNIKIIKSFESNGLNSTETYKKLYLELTHNLSNP